VTSFGRHEYSSSMLRIRRHAGMALLLGMLLLPNSSSPMTYPASVAAVQYLDQPADRFAIRGTLELRGTRSNESRKLLRSARVHATPASRDKEGPHQSLGQLDRHRDPL
jgi:hypothetical protein